MEMQSDLKGLLQTVMPWGFPVLALAAAVICFTAVRVSSRVIVLGIGFLLGAAAGVGNRLVLQLLIHSAGGPPAFERYQQYSMMLSGLVLLSWVVIVVGLALVFADLRQRLSRASYGPPTGREEPRPWRPRQEGRQDIQQ